MRAQWLLSYSPVDHFPLSESVFVGAAGHGLNGKGSQEATSQVISLSYVILPKRGVPQISQIAKVLAYQDFTEHFSGISVILWAHLI